MPFSNDSDQKESRAYRLNGDNEIVTALGIKNCEVYTKVSWPGQNPSSHLFVDIVTTQVPTNDNYPDSKAPIGSTCKVFTFTGTAVSGCRRYTKISAGNWQLDLVDSDVP